MNFRSLPMFFNLEPTSTYLASSMPMCRASHRRRLTLLFGVMIISLSVFSAACGQDADTESVVSQQSSLTTDHIDKAAEKANSPKKDIAPFRSAAFMTRFDVTATSASATSLGLDANLKFDATGRMEIQAIPSRDPYGKLQTLKPTYTLGNPLFGREGALQKLASPKADLGSKQIRYEFAASGITAVYNRHKDGIEQAFEIERAPNGNGPLLIKYEAPKGFEHQLDPKSDAIQITADGHRGMRLEELVVFDAKFQNVPAKFFVDNGVFGYEIDDSKATYPLHVDPLFTSPDTILNGENAGGEFGYVVNRAGDLNNDGFDDIVVGERYYSNGEDKEGRILVFLGSASGVVATASDAIESNLTNANLGVAFSSLGDVDGDGNADLAVGAPFANSNTGTIFVFAGQATLNLGDPALKSAPIFEKSGDSPAQRFGYSIASGDINCDGNTDLVIGAPQKDTFKGAVYGFSGDRKDTSEL